MTRAEIHWLSAREIPRSWKRLWRDIFRQNLSSHPHCQDILQSTSCNIWDFLQSCWGCLHPWGLTFVYSKINLDFLGIKGKVNLLRFFSCTVLYDFVSELAVTQNIFLSCPKHFYRRLAVVIVYYFQILNKRERNIIIVKIWAVTWVPCILRHTLSLSIYIYIYIYR